MQAGHRSRRYGLNRGLGIWLPMRGEAADFSGNGHSPTISGATLTTDRFGRDSHAYSFDGNDYIEYPDANSLRPTPPFTFALWLLRGDIGRDQTAFSKYTGQSGNWKSYSLDFPATNKILFRVENKALNQFPQWATDAAFASTVHSYHIAIVYREITGVAADVEIWVDGVREAITLTAGNYTSGYALQYGATPLGVGVRENDSRTGFLNGHVMGLRLYSTGLSGQKIRQLAGMKE